MIRCAIYTRKSRDEGLDQSFGSLDAQHEACFACIASQRHEGWKLIPERFDNGARRAGDLLTPTHTTRRGRRLPYYISNRLIRGGTDPSGWRLPAELLEAGLQRILAAHIREAAVRHTLLTTLDVSAAQAIAAKAQRLADQISKDKTGLVR